MHCFRDVPRLYCARLVVDSCHAFFEGQEHIYVKSKGHYKYFQRRVLQATLHLMLFLAVVTMAAVAVVLSLQFDDETTHRWMQTVFFAVFFSFALLYPLLVSLTVLV